MAVFRDDQGAFVYLFDKNKVIKKPVVAGRMVGDLWVINSGLKESDAVVVNGGVKVSADEQVIVDSRKDQVIDSSNPASAPVPKVVTPSKDNASSFKANTNHTPQIDNSANIYSGKY